MTFRPAPAVLALLAVLAPAAASAAPDAEAAAPRPETLIRTIVLDPGHGGEEVGAVGKSGLLEKDLCLDIARRLQERLTRNQKVNVLLTREEDRLVPLRERTAIANHAKADIFISVHLNSSRRASAHGTESYFLALTASDEEALILAQAENIGAAVPGGEPAAGNGAAAGQTNGSAAAPPPAGAADSNQSVSDLDLVLGGMAQSEHIVRSSRLAEVIQDEMNRLLNVQSRGVKQAPFSVLMGATMPSALVEVAFLSNESEEKMLATPEFRDKVAEALEIAIVRFKYETEKALTAAPDQTGAEPLP